MNAYQQAALQRVSKLFSLKQTYTPWGIEARIEGMVRPIFQCGPGKKSVAGCGGLAQVLPSQRDLDDGFGFGPR